MVRCTVLFCSSPFVAVSSVYMPGPWVLGSLSKDHYRNLTHICFAFPRLLVCIRSSAVFPASHPIQAITWLVTSRRDFTPTKFTTVFTCALELFTTHLTFPLHVFYSCLPRFHLFHFILYEPTRWCNCMLTWAMYCSVVGRNYHVSRFAVTCSLHGLPLVDDFSYSTLAPAL